MILKISSTICFSLAIFCSCFSQNTICLTDQSSFVENHIDAKSISDLKVVRINYHFMLKSDGSGNFTEQDDGNGNSNYTGYDYATEITAWMNGRASWNQALSLDPNNNIPAIDKNFRYVVDAIYFHRDDNSYYFQTINVGTQGADRDSVLNIFFTHSLDSSGGGYASSLSPSSKNKFTENRHIWESYISAIQNSTPMGWIFHGDGSNLNHELCHLMGLSHTVKWNGSGACGTGCSNLTGVNDPPGATNPINTSCDDGCSDTPTAWEITQLNGCSQHPACGWWNNAVQLGKDMAYCSNNVMDYSGENALSPCQINKIHSNLEAGMHTYLACTAVQSDTYFEDIGYPRVSYFGRNVNIGKDTNTNAADITDQEKLSVYFSESVELENFDINATDASFEIIFTDACSF